MFFFYAALLFLQAYALALFFGMAFVYFRDLRHLLGILLQLWFYGTPILYHEKMIPEKFEWITFANPVGGIFIGIHQTMTQGQWPSQGLFISAVAWTVGLVLLSLLFQKAVEKNLVEDL